MVGGNMKKILVLLLVLGLCVPVNAVNMKRPVVNIKKNVVKPAAVNRAAPSWKFVVATAVGMTIMFGLILYANNIHYKEEIETLQKNLRSARQNQASSVVTGNMASNGKGYKGTQRKTWHC
jgi:hypothetical protein